MTAATDSPGGDDPPNVVFVIADDLAYGDLGCHGNPVVETPRIDDIYGEGVRCRRFYGGPMCSPSRASLLTGRDHYRTGVVDTYLGRSLLRPDETTLPELLSAAGYRTGCFGKWHLGDNYPLRPVDRGFDETLVHRGGGIGQPGDVPGNTYVDPVLSRNGGRVETTGYCTDVFADAAIEFIEGSDEPFFAYLAPNAPHVPLQVPDGDADPYRERGLDEHTARLYGLVSNLDANVGRVLDALDRAGVAEETLVVVTSDHGPEGGDRFNAGLRGAKGTPYEGGIRVPFLARWPGVLDGGRDVDALGHFVDVVPTLAAVADAPLPDRPLDGRNIGPRLADGDEHPDDRRLFLQMHRGDEPERYRNSAVVTSRYKLVDGRELYDLDSDPGEQRDLAGEQASARARSARPTTRGSTASCRTTGTTRPGSCSARHTRTPQR